MRVIAGSAGGRRLSAPRGTHTRPTSDRVKEALFSSLGEEVVDAVALDLFAGTGALGIEALSRGAASATFVERDARAAAVITENLRTTGLEDGARVVQADAAAFVRRAAPAPYTLVLCDPPYAEALDGVIALVAALDEAGSLAPGAMVVVEREKRDPRLASIDDLQGLLAVERQRSYGDTVLLYLRTKDA